ncbi:uncharacterized protein LOC120124635 [Hibiscus syriacus]|uniref:uncharacterized protein LOC120124635 n=1 Tax=Hibiscus syriacus TaxID=106335 RepID=UPI001923D0C8|nr:uncharacterized protein LOC120124635 [Hibiscus syriacus]
MTDIRKWMIARTLLLKPEYNSDQDDKELPGALLRALGSVTRSPDHPHCPSASGIRTPNPTTKLSSLPLEPPILKPWNDMGKAGKWLVNFLLGRKDEKAKRKNLSLSFEEGTLITNPCATPSPSSSFKRRWSFGKLSSKDRAAKSSRSFDLVTATPLATKTVSDMEIRHNNNNVFAMAMASSTKRKTKATYAAVLHVAATRIQAAFRSYLARKALHALRGLVKLQALVRGHLVRKQTTVTLRSMHALMAIQVRARFKRVKMAEEPQLAVKSQSSRYARFSHEIEFKRTQRVLAQFPLSQGLQVAWSSISKDLDYIDSMEGATLSGRQASAYICDVGEESAALQKKLAAVGSQEQMEILSVPDVFSLV